MATYSERDAIRLGEKSVHFVPNLHSESIGFSLVKISVLPSLNVPVSWKLG